MMNSRNWKTYANQKFSNYREYKKFRTELAKTKGMANVEQKWADTYLQPVIDFMGDYELWNYFSNSQIDVREQRNTRNIINDHLTAIFTGGHWYGYKPGKKQLFDPYSKYQYPGSNQFCQTFTLMYLTNNLPQDRDVVNKSFKNYYDYTLDALLFINQYIIVLKDQKINSEVTKKLNNIQKKVLMLLKYPNMALNCVELIN